MVKTVLGTIVGAALGFGYYRFIGCAGGSCPITSNPWMSTLYGALMGFMIANMSGGT